MKEYVVIWTDNGGTHEEAFTTKEAAEDFAANIKARRLTFRIIER